MDGSLRNARIINHRDYSILVTIKSLAMIFLMGGAVLLSISSCATVQTGPLASGELRLINIEVSQREEIREKQPVMVSIRFEADGNPNIIKACFLWSGKGPICSKINDINYVKPGLVQMQLPSRSPGRYLLETYFMYIRDGKTETTNVVGTDIRVFKQ